MKKGKNYVSAAGTAIGLGLLTCLTVSILMTVIVTFTINSNVLAPEMIGYAAVAILMLSAFAGASVSVVTAESKKLICCVMTGVCYFLVLMAGNGLFFGARYGGVWQTAAAIMGASLGSLLLLIRKNHSHSRGYPRHKFQ